MGFGQFGVKLVMLGAPQWGRLPDKNPPGLGQHRATGAGVGLIGDKLEQAAFLKGFRGGRHGGGIHRQKFCEFAQARLPLAAEGHQHRELAVGQAQRREQAVKSARQLAGRALGGKAQALVVDLQHGFDGEA